jgi:hypothetical protein
MASDDPKAQRRPPAPPRALVLGAVLIGVGWLAYGVFGTSDPEPAPVAAGEPRGAVLPRPAGDRPAAPAKGEPSRPAPAAPEPVTAAAVVGAASSGFGGRAEALAMRRLGRTLAVARRNGGTPVAVVTSRTELRAAPGGRVLERLGTETEFGSPRVQAVVGREREWLEVRAAELPNGKTGWVSSLDIDVEGIDHSLHASLQERTLEVRRRGRVVRRVEVAIGGPATPTPTGAFAVTDKLRMTEDGGAYGCCALAFTGKQPTIPQGWSGGDRLAVHGTPHEATIGQSASLGCLRADDADMRWLTDRVPLGAPVTVTR